MSLTPAAMRLLAEKGLSLDDIIAVAEANFSRSDGGPAKSKAALRMARYRDRRRENGLSPTFDGGTYVAQLQARDGLACVYCQASDGTVVDHIVPTSNGGLDEPGNLALACHACNCGKAGRPTGGKYTLQVESARQAHVRYVREHGANRDFANNREQVREQPRTPRARVEDKPSNSFNPRLADDAVDETQARDQWPSGDVVRLLVEEIGSPWLDPAKSPDLITTSGRLAAWKRQGAHWRHDVIPVVSGLCAKARKRIGTWAYFDGAIAQAIADNSRAMTLPEARAAPAFVTMSDRLAAENAEARRLAFARLDAANG